MIATRVLATLAGIVMNSLLILVATAAMGVEVGWEPLPGGGYEYTIQIEPELLKLLEQGNDEIFSEVPAGIDVRRYRVMVGVGKVRRESAPLAANGSLPAEQPAAAAPAARQAAPTAQPFAAAPPAAATADPFGTPPSDPEAELDADLGQRSLPAAAAPPAASPTPAATAPFGDPTPSAQHPYDEPPPPAVDPRQTAPAATEPAAQPESSGPSMPDFGNSAAAPSAEMSATESIAANSKGLEPIPSNPWAKERSKSESEGRAETLTVPPAANAPAADLAKAPEKLPNAGNAAGPIQAATFDEKDAATPSGERETAKPELDEVPVSRPWIPFVAAIVLLGCSIGGNVFLGWVAYDARHRYRNAIAKFRGAAA
jgi:hypothetical protein